MDRPANLNDHEWNRVKATLATKGVCLLLAGAFIVYGLGEAIRGDFARLTISLAFAFFIASYTPLLPPELAEKMEGIKP